MSEPGEPKKNVPTEHDGLQLASLLVEEGLRIQTALARMVQKPLLRAPSAVSAQAPSADSETSECNAVERELHELLETAERLLLAHPVVTQRAFAALAAEGRSFAKTNEGQRWIELLAPSEALSKARRIFSASLLNVLEEDTRTHLPSAYLETLFRTLRASDKQIEAALVALRKD